MPNPTDRLTYAVCTSTYLPQFVAGRQARQAPAGYLDAHLDFYQFLGLGFSAASIAAGAGGVATQTPQPNIPYADWANVAIALEKLRVSLGQTPGYAEGVFDCYRRFSGEHWWLEAILEDIIGAAHTNQPFAPLF